jgi:hypothetical protein
MEAPNSPPTFGQRYQNPAVEVWAPLPVALGLRETIRRFHETNEYFQTGS